MHPGCLFGVLLVSLSCISTANADELGDDVRHVRCGDGDNCRQSMSSSLQARVFAIEAVSSMWKLYYNSVQNYFNFHSPADEKLADYWTYAQAFETVIDGFDVGVFGNSTVHKMYDGRDNFGWTTDNIDDKNWMALALFRAHVSVTSSARPYLTTTLRLADEIAYGWDGDDGGIWRDSNHTQKSTTSNLGPVILFARLYGTTHNVTQFSFAKQIFDHWIESAYNTSTGQIADYIHVNGTISWSKYTHNQGLLIGAATQLYMTSKDPRYLEIARHAYQFLITAESRNGVLYDGGDGCDGDCMQFKGIACRYVTQYAMVMNDTSVKSQIKHWATTIQNKAWNQNTMMFSVDWNGPARESRDEFLSTHTSAAMCVACAEFVQ